VEENQTTKDQNQPQGKEPSRDDATSATSAEKAPNAAIDTQKMRWIITRISCMEQNNSIKETNQEIKKSKPKDPTANHQLRVIVLTPKKHLGF
jgi:hypothetical protein